MTQTKPLVVHPETGRQYAMGPMSARFIADTDETASRVSISEWWLEPDTVAPQTPPAHAHPEDHTFYVIEGELSIQLDGTWHTAARGSYVFIPGGTEHTFENRSSDRVGFISFNAPGGFENQMPAIVEWFEK